MTASATAPPVERKPYREAFTAYGEREGRVLCVTNDLTASVEADGFRDRFPDRTFSLGMAEQNLVGVLAGMAREGFLPFYPTFAVFATRRPYEQIAMSIAYPALPVRIVGFLPGLTTPGGVTHQATDDLALMTQLPNMTVLEVGDATEACTVLDVIDAIDGPVYCRMLRGEVPRLFDTPIAFDRVRELAVGDDVQLITSGVHTGISMEVVERLRAAGVDAGHLHVSTLKPFGDPLVAERLATAAHVVTVEDHLLRGGLATAVGELMLRTGAPGRLHRVGIDDTWTHGGSRDYLFGYYRLDADAIIEAVEGALGQRILEHSEAAEADGAQRHHTAVAEGL